MEFNHVDVKQAFIQADVEEEVYIELPEEYQDFLGSVGRLLRALHGLVQASRNSILMATGTLEGLNFEHLLGQSVPSEKGARKREIKISIDYIR